MDDNVGETSSPQPSRSWRRILLTSLPSYVALTVAAVAVGINIGFSGNSHWGQAVSTLMIAATGLIGYATARDKRRGK